MYCAERRVDGGVRFKIQLAGWLPCIESEQIFQTKVIQECTSGYLICHKRGFIFIVKTKTKKNSLSYKFLIISFSKWLHIFMS